MFSAETTSSAVISSPMAQPTSKPGRSLCQYVALQLDLAVLPTQPHEFFAFCAAEAFFARQGLAFTTSSLCYPVGDALR